MITRTARQRLLRCGLLSLGILLAGSVGALAQGGPFNAQIENFWRVVSNGGRAFSDLAIAASGYLNFGTTLGTNGYGLRDSAGTIQFKDSGGSWTSLPIGGVAPVDATYITETANSTLTAELALGSLATGLLSNTTTTGIPTVVANVAAGQLLTSGTPPAWSASPTGITLIGAATLNATSAYQVNGVLAVSATAPTVSGFGTSPSVVNANGTAAFTINIGTGGVASTGTITLPTATTGWWVSCFDVTTPASFVTNQTGGSTTTATVTNYSRTTGLAIAWTASDILRCHAEAY